MNLYYKKLIFVGLFVSSGLVMAHSQLSQRVPQFSNEKVSVWKTIVYPKAPHILKMHRHEHDRVVIALSNGVLKVTNNKGVTHFLTLKKDTAYFLNKDAPNEFHTDENISHTPIKVMVIELKPHNG